MDVVSRWFKEDKIDKEKYKRAATKATLIILQANGYQCRLLGKGTFADIVEVKSNHSELHLVAKIVAQKYCTEGETQLWQNLKHENILPLVSCQNMDPAHTTIFLMHIQPTSLDCITREKELSKDVAGLERARSWLKGILQGVSYIHEQNLCHLDLKLNNVLISSTDTALICDFGFLASATENVKRSGTPFPFLPPESFMPYGGTDGRKFDIWTLGVMITELVTENAIWKHSKRRHLISCWFLEISPVFQSIITEKEVFESYVKDTTFPVSNVTSETVNQLHNLISLCLNIEPRHRPEASELLDHAFFAGPAEKVGALSFNDKMPASFESSVIGPNIIEYVAKTSSDDAESVKIKESSSLRTTLEESYVTQSSSEDGQISSAQMSVDRSTEIFEQTSFEDEHEFDDDIERDSHHDDANNCVVDSQSSSEDGLISPAQISLESLIKMFEGLSIKDDHKCDVDIDRAAHDDDNNDLSVCESEKKSRTRRQKFCSWMRRKFSIPRMFASCCGKSRQ